MMDNKYGVKSPPFDKNYSEHENNVPKNYHEDMYSRNIPPKRPVFKEPLREKNMGGSGYGKNYFAQTSDNTHIFNQGDKSDREVVPATKYPTESKESNNSAHFKYSDFDAFRSYMIFNVGTLNTGEILEDFKQELSKKKITKKSRRNKSEFQIQSIDSNTNLSSNSKMTKDDHNVPPLDKVTHRGYENDYFQKVSPFKLNDERELSKQYPWPDSQQIKNPGPFQKEIMNMPPTYSFGSTNYPENGNYQQYEISEPFYDIHKNEKLRNDLQKQQTYSAVFGIDHNFAKFDPERDSYNFLQKGDSLGGTHRRLNDKARNAYVPVQRGADDGNFEYQNKNLLNNNEGVFYDTLQMKESEKSYFQQENTDSKEMESLQIIDIGEIYVRSFQSPKDMESFVEELRTRMVHNPNEIFYLLQKQKLMINERNKSIEMVGMYGPEHTLEIAFKDIKSARLIILSKQENTSIMNIQHEFGKDHEHWGTIIFTRKGNIYDKIESLLLNERKAVDSVALYSPPRDESLSKKKGHKIFENQETLANPVPRREEFSDLRFHGFESNRIKKNGIFSKEENRSFQPDFSSLGLENSQASLNGPANSHQSSKNVLYQNNLKYLNQNSDVTGYTFPEKQREQLFENKSKNNHDFDNSSHEFKGNNSNFINDSFSMEENFNMKPEEKHKNTKDAKFSGMTEADFFLETGRPTSLNTGNFNEVSHHNSSNYDNDPSKIYEAEHKQGMDDTDLKNMKDKLKNYHKFNTNKSESPQLNKALVNNLKTTDPSDYNYDGDRPLGMAQGIKPTMQVSPLGSDSNIGNMSVSPNVTTYNVNQNPSPLINPFQMSPDSSNKNVDPRKISSKHGEEEKKDEEEEEEEEDDDDGEDEEEDDEVENDPQKIKEKSDGKNNILSGVQGLQENLGGVPSSQSKAKPELAIQSSKENVGSNIKPTGAGVRDESGVLIVDPNILQKNKEEEKLQAERKAKFDEYAIILKKGKVFMKYGHNNLFGPSKRKIYFSSDLRKLFWTKPNTQKILKTFDFGDITQVLDGRQTDNFKRVSKKKDPIKDVLSFSIVLKDRTIDLQAETQIDKQEFYKALFEIHNLSKSMNIYQHL